jgi:ribonucleotide monophosphatase NagD (HAD superfamily)
MIIPNPDKIWPDVAHSPMPGTIGNAYEKAIDGNDILVKYIGKPLWEVYEIALRNKDRIRACMIGDALETDITGGLVEDIDTIWVANDGVHIVENHSKGNELLEKGYAALLEDFIKLESAYAKDRQLLTTIVMPHFQW